ncbi:hypothetical protein IM538_13110 [Cytobacillus suaedae]|nr:hypothetical protein IM538_13110 [Cytobacillus suaedae]
MSKAQKFIWFFLAILGFANGAITLTFYKQSTLSILAGSGQILGGIILLLVIYTVYKRKDNDSYI